MRRVSIALATLFGAGYFPVAPATLGSLLTLGLWWWMSAWPPALYLGATAALALLAFWICGEAEKSLGHDAQPIILDEVVGMLVTMAFAPPHNLPAAAAGFLLFRFFDILKPPPAYNAQNLPGGFGVVMDDVFAGLYALGILRGAGWLLGRAHIVL